MLARNESSTTTSADSSDDNSDLENLSRSDARVYTIYSLTILGLILILVSWCAIKLYQISESVLKKHRTKQRANSNATNNAMQMRLRQRSNWSYWLERLFTSVFAMNRSHQAVAVLSVIVVLIRMLRFVHNWNKQSVAQIRFVYYILYGLIFWFQGFVFQARLLSTFQITKSAVPHRNKVKNAFVAVDVFLASLGVLSIFFLILAQNGNVPVFVPTLLGICSTVYVAECVYLILTFWKATLKVACNDNDDGDNMDRLLVDSALRVTVCAAISIFSNFVIVTETVLSLFVCDGKCPLATFLIGDTLVAIDNATNVFALLCSYQEGSKYYFVVFGSLHRWLFQYVADNR